MLHPQDLAKGARDNAIKAGCLVSTASPWCLFLEFNWQVATESKTKQEEVKANNLSSKVFFCESGKRKLKKYYFGDTPWLVNRGAHVPWHLIVTRLLWSQIWAAWMKSWPLRIKTWRRHPLRGGYGITSSELCKNEEEMKLYNKLLFWHLEWFFIKCHSKIFDFWNATNLMLPEKRREGRQQEPHWYPGHLQH